MRGRGGFRGWMLVGLVPALFALDLGLPVANGLPTGVGEALGCSGAGNGPIQDGSWTSLAPALTDYTQRADVPVATDGFFAIYARGNGLALETAQAELGVVVTDAGGNEVAGDVSVLGTRRESPYLFGWTARDPLPIGVTLTASLGTAPGSKGAGIIGGQFPLRVEGEPTPLPEPELAFLSWSKYYRGEGDSVQCTPLPYASCIGTVAVPGSVVEQVLAHAGWTPPQLSGGVAWEVRVELGPEQEEAGTFSVADEFLGHVPESGFLVGRVVFPDQAERYCATVVIEDLRTGRERRAEACSVPKGAREPAETDTRLGLCAEPPTAGLTRAWCELKSFETPPPQCVQFLTVGEAPGTEVLAGSSADDDPTDASSSRSRGCQLGAARSSPPLLAALAGLAFGWLRRPRFNRKR